MVRFLKVLAVISALGSAGCVSMTIGGIGKDYRNDKVAATYWTDDDTVIVQTQSFTGGSRQYICDKRIAYAYFKGFDNIITAPTEGKPYGINSALHTATQNLWVYLPQDEPLCQMKKRKSLPSREELERELKTRLHECTPVSTTAETYPYQWCYSGTVDHSVQSYRPVVVGLLHPAAFLLDLLTPWGLMTVYSEGFKGLWGAVDFEIGDRWSRHDFMLPLEDQDIERYVGRAQRGEKMPKE